VARKRDIVVRDNQGWAFWAADRFTKRAKECVTSHGRFTVALSGGSTPRPVHRLLGQGPYRSEIPWTGTHLFWVDDRCVPETSPASNFGAAKQDLLDHIPLPASQIHPMPVAAPPEDGARQYEQELREFFASDKSGFPVFDWIFLGVGQDGHMASLFPGHDSLDEREQWVVVAKGGSPHVSRLTMTLPVLNSAREIVFLVAGKGKAAVMQAIFAESGTLLPAQRVQPVTGRLTWLVEKQASSLLSREVTC